MQSPLFPQVPVLARALAALTTAAWFCAGCGDQLLPVIDGLPTAEEEIPTQPLQRLTACPESAGNDLHLETDTPFSWGYAGAVFSKPAPAPYEPRFVQLQVKNSAGEIVPSCEVNWYVAKGSGWVFTGQPFTDAGGNAEARWTAGPDTSQRLIATVLSADREPHRIALLGSVQRAQPWPSSIYLNYRLAYRDIGSLSGFQVEALPRLREAVPSSFIAMQFGGCYAGIDVQPRASLDADQPATATYITFACQDDRVEVVANPRSDLTHCESGNERHARCQMAIDYPWQVGKGYRFVLTSAVRRERQGDFTDFSLAVTDVTTAEQVRIATISYAKILKLDSFASLIQTPPPKAQLGSCIDAEKREMEIRNLQARYGSEWRFVKEAHFDRNDTLGTVCANYLYGVKNDAFFLSTGGDQVGPPLFPEDASPILILP